MKLFLVRVSWYQPYPRESEYRIEATSVPTAVARALRLWKKEIGRKRWDNLTVRVIKAN